MRTMELLIQCSWISHNATLTHRSVLLQKIFTCSLDCGRWQNYMELSSPGYLAFQVREGAHLYVAWPVQLSQCILFHLFFGLGKVGRLDRQISRLFTIAKWHKGRGYYSIRIFFLNNWRTVFLEQPPPDVGTIEICIKCMCTRLCIKVEAQLLCVDVFMAGSLSAVPKFRLGTGNPWTSSTSTKENTLNRPL